jgi:hypothetical protein
VGQRSRVLQIGIMFKNPRVSTDVEGERTEECFLFQAAYDAYELLYERRGVSSRSVLSRFTKLNIYFRLYWNRFLLNVRLSAVLVFY